MNKNERVFKWLTIIINILFCLILPISVLMALTSPMMFDSPGSSASTNILTLFASAFTLPAVILISVISSSVLLSKYKKFKKAFMFSLLPFVNFLVFVLALISSK